jgi:MSHA biogenesis protein MshL
MMQKSLLKLSALLSLMLLAACASNEPQQNATLNKIKNELKLAAEVKAPPASTNAINDALLPPLKIAMPKASAKQLEQRFDLVISNAPASQVLMGIVSGTRYSMLVHQDLTGTISVNLKDVTVFEALDSLRELYGYEYKVEGTRIFIEPQAMQTRVFQVNYIVGQRKGSSDTRVTSGSVSNSNSQSGQQGTSSSSTSVGGSEGRAPLISTSIATSSNNDFWKDLTDSLNGIVGAENGRRVVVNLQSGVIMVRAMPDEVRNVEAFLRLMQVTIERQVILEAKILNVQLNDQSQSGVNWSIFGRSGSSTGIVGNINANTQLASSGNGSLLSGDLGTSSGTVIANAATTAIGGPLFAVALQGANFKDDNIILHMHPSISQVTTVNKQLNLGGAAGAINLPLASSNVSETDSIVRTRHGRVIAIGGLMTESAIVNKSKVPGLGDIKGIGSAFRQKGSATSKTELVILLKATVVQGQDSWSNDALSSQHRIENMQRLDSLAQTSTVNE